MKRLDKVTYMKRRHKRCRGRWIIEEWQTNPEKWKRVHTILFPSADPKRAWEVNEGPRALPPKELTQALCDVVRLRDFFPARIFRIRQFATQETVMAAIMGQVESLPK